MRSSRLSNALSVLIVILSVFAARAASAAEPALQGTVHDQSGGAIVGATVTAENGNGETKKAVTDQRGEYRFDELPPGEYAVSVEFPGFSPVERRVTVAPAKTAHVDVTLEIHLEEQVQVADTISLHDSPLTRTLTRKELALLPNDSRQLLQRLRELAGTRGQQGDVVIYVDGFREGVRVPPKDNIEMIRVSAHPFSAEFPEPGHARIEITSRPGSEKVTADISATFNSDKLNARDYFAPTKPESETRHFTAYLGAPILPKRLSFSLFGGRWSEDATDVFNATVLDSSATPQPLSGSVRAPTRVDSFLAGVNSLAGRRHTTRLLFGYTGRRAENQGLDTVFDLPEHVHDSNTDEFSVRGSLLSILAPTLLNEAHVEFTHRDYAHAAAVRTPETLVLDAFYDGGDQNALFMDERTRSVQIRNTTTLGYRQLMLKAGVQAERAESSLVDRTGFGGSFLFGTDVERDALGLPLRDANGDTVGISPLERYRRTVLGVPGYGPSQYTIVSGNPDLGYSQWWTSWFAQSDWTARPGLTLSLWRPPGMADVHQRSRRACRPFGLRLDDRLEEPQHRSRRRRPVLLPSRSGADAGHDAIRRPPPARARDRPAGTYPAPPPIDTNVPQTLHTKASDLAAPRLLVATASYERVLPGGVVAVVEYAHDRGERLLLRRNVNAPLFDGTTPIPGSGPVLEYGSLGESRSDQLLTSVRVTVEGTMMVIGGYRRTWSRATTDGFRTAPADPNDLEAEWGMPVSDREHRAHLGATFYLPWDVFFSPYVTASTGRPFNITTGRDTNRDTLYAERPAFAAEGDPSAISTPLGLLTLDPAATAIVPRNFGRGQPEVRLDLHLSKLTRVSKQMKVTLACDVQNALNSGLFNGYYTIVTAPLFTEPNRALPTRRVLLTARVSY